MSTLFGPARTSPARTRSSQPPAPRLTVVHDAPFRPPRMPFVLFVVALLGAGLVGLLLLNTELQRGAFQVTELNRQADDLRDQQEALEREVRTLEAPQNLATRALKQGMVPNPNPVFLRLSDGRVLGVPAEGKAGSGAAVFGQVLPKPKPKPAAVVPTARPATPLTPLTPKPPTAATTRPPAARTPAGTATKPPKPPARAGTARTSTAPRTGG